MGADIDQLNIKIEADAQKAHSSVDTLINKLGRLNAALGTINTSNLTSLSNGVQRLANSMQSMKNVGTADFTRLANNISKMGAIDAASVSRAASSVHRFSNALSKLDTIKVSDNAAQIGQLANGIKQLGYKSSTQAIENIPKLATAMRQLMTELSKAPKVSQNLIQMTEALARLSRTGASSGRAATSLGKSLDSYAASTHRASKGSFSLSAAIGKVYATYWLLFRAFGKIKDAINISSHLTEVQNVVDVTFGNMSRKVEDFAKTSIEQFGMSELPLKQYASRFQAMGSAMGISGSSIGSANSFLNKQTSGYVNLSNSMADVSLNLTKLTADMASFYNVEQSAVAEDLASVFTGQTRPLRQYGLDLTQATLKEWALKNGLDADIKSMSQAEKTMLRYQYVMANTGAAQGDFARTANTWANQIRILKQNFEQLGSVIGGTLINAFKPLVQALNSVMGKLISFAETVSNALGKIFGWKYESGGGGITSDLETAEDSADGIAGGIGDAADNAKKLKNNLLAIDELNVISPDEGGSSGSGSGSSGGASSGSSGSGGQWVKQDSIFDDYKSSIDSLYGLGEYIGQTITNELNGINWDSVYEGARNFGKGLANFLNGLISPELFGATGRTIASALNTAIYAALSFGETFDFYDFGVSIATGINNFFETFDFGSLAKTLNTWVDGLEDAIAGFLKTVKWSDILKKVGTFLGDLELDTIAVILGALLLKNKSGQLLGGSWLASQIAAKLGITNGQLLLYAGLTVSVGLITWEFANHMRGWIDSLKEWWNETSVGSSHVGYDEEGNEIEVHLSMKATIDRMSTQWKVDLENWWKNDVAGWFEKKDWDTISDIIKGNISLSDAVSQWQTDISNWWKNDVSAWFQEKDWNTLADVINGNIKLADAVSQWKTDISTWWKENVSPWFTQEQWSGVIKTIKDNINLSGTAKQWGTDIQTWWDEKVSPWFTQEQWQGVIDVINGNVKISDAVSQWQTDISTWWKDDVEKWFTKKKWNDAMSGVVDAFEETWGTAISSIKQIWNNFAKWLNEKLTWTIDPVVIAGKTIFEGTTINLGKIPTFQVGGFPEDGLFMANHTELVGQFSNGKTAVANNEMIVAGIEEAAYRGFVRAYAENSREADLLQELIYAVREGKEITIDGRSLVKAYDTRKARNGFSFT